MTELLQFFEKIERDMPDNCLALFFSHRNIRKGIYISHQPVVGNDVQHAIIKTIIPYIKQQLSQNTSTSYNPMGVLDGYIEKMDKAMISATDTFFDSIAEDRVYRDLSTLKVDQIGFYCTKIQYNEETVYVFRQFQKLKKLRNGFFSQIFDAELRVIENDIIGIDQISDIIIFEGNLYLLNHIALERVFNYRDEFHRKTDEAIQVIGEKDIITNLELFSTDCLNDVRIMKRFTALMSNGRLPLFFEHYDRVPGIVARLRLDIDFDEQGKLQYRDKSQLFHIVNLFSDAYFQSLLADRTGVALVEGDI